MKNKIKKKLSFFIGVVLISCGVVIFFVDRYLDYKTSQTVKEIVDSDEVIINNSNETTEPTLDDLIAMESESEGIEVMTSDQEVEEVTTYKRVISIPEQDILAHIYNDVSSNSLRYGVGWYDTTVPLGEVGNCVIAGHSSTIYKCIFNNLHNMKLLDSFLIYDDDGEEHKYYVTDIKTVEPTDLYILDNTNDGVSQVTLFTCTDEGRKRLVLIGRELTDEEYYTMNTTLESTKIENLNKMNDSLSVGGWFNDLSEN